MQQTRVNLCKKHNEEIVILDVSGKNSHGDNQLCLKCLTPFLKQQQLMTVDNAVEMMSNIKYEFGLKMEEQNNKNLDKIKNLLSEIKSTKTTIDQQFNKVIDNLQQWISSIEEQNQLIKQKQNELITLNIEEFQQALILIQQNNKSTIELKSSIQEQLMFIVKSDNIQKCLQSLDSIEFIQKFL